MIRKILVLVILAILTISLVGCQTVAGLGGDIQWAAESTADAISGDGEYE